MKFKKEFFSEESREGFVVPEMMKRAWAAEIEVLEVISDACDALGIKYYAYYGTLLGTIRHKGFIPWDDDIDLCMLQEDYYKFLSEAPDVLPNGFVISGMHAKEPRLWKANTSSQARVIADELFFTFPRYMERFHSFPYMRIGIDIFPLYRVPKNIEKQIELLSLVNEMQATANSLELYRQKGLLEERLLNYERILGEELDYSDDDSLAHSIRLGLDRIVRFYSEYESDCVYDILYEKFPEELSGFGGITGLRQEWFGEGCLKEFEEKKIRVPINFSEVLKVKYGEDYMTPKKFSSSHGYPFYKEQEKAFKNLLVESGVNTPVDEFCRGWHMLHGGE